MFRWAALLCALALCACGSVLGPNSITASRTFYNEVIHDTSSEQLLLNIIRAKNYETPVFMDVSEADATVAFTGAVTGGASNIGGKPGTSGTSLFGTIGAVGGTFTYGDQALVRYTPVLGYPLIQQISTPISPESMVHMFDSDYPLASILEMSADRLTPGYEDYYPAQDRMVLLDSYGSLVLTQLRVGARAMSRGADPQAEDRGSETAAQDQDLNVIIQNRAPVPPPMSSDCPLVNQLENSAANVRSLWDSLARLYGISLAAKRITLQGGNTGAGFFFRTRSAAGTLKLAETPTILIETPEIADQIIAYNNLAPCHLGRGLVVGANGAPYKPSLFYFLGASGLGDLTQDAIESDWENFFRDALQSRITPQLRNDTLGRDTRRVFILIEKSPSLPHNAYVAVSRGGYWYSIRLDDYTSKNNFALLNEIVTIQAAPEPNSHLTPSINIGR